MDQRQRQRRPILRSRSLPRGGSSDGGHSGGSSGGHDSGHDSTVAGLEGGTHDEHEGGSGGGGKAVFCEHVVEMHQVEVVLPPADPPIEEEGESPTPPDQSVSPPATESPVGAVRPTVASAASAPQDASRHGQHSVVDADRRRAPGGRRCRTDRDHACAGRRGGRYRHHPVATTDRSDRPSAPRPGLIGVGSTNVSLAAQ